MITFQHEENDKKGKFIILVESNPAGEISYVWTGESKFIIDHTETYKGYEGKGYAKKLVHKAVEFAKEKQVKILPLCPYAKSVMEKDKELRKMIV